MKVIKAPRPFIHETRDKFTIFLGGSIEMGFAENWQERLTNDLAKYSDQLVLLNPRRDDWNSDWAQDPTPGTRFHGQVRWETDAQSAHSDLIVYYFAPGTKSPITFLELGCYGGNNPHNTIVCCPPEFCRYGNVYMFCEDHNIDFTESYEDMLCVIEKKLEDKNISCCLSNTSENMTREEIERMVFNIVGAADYDLYKSLVSELAEDPDDAV